MPTRPDTVGPSAVPVLGRPITRVGLVPHYDGSTHVRGRPVGRPAISGSLPLATCSRASPGEFRLLPVLSPLHGLRTSRYRGGHAFRRSPRRWGIAPHIRHQVVQGGSPPWPLIPWWLRGHQFRGNESQPGV